MARRAESIFLLRTLYRELRPSVNAPQKHVYETQIWKYIMGLCKNCRSQPPSKIPEIQRNLEQTGRSYVLYLQGTREYHRISDEYKGAGERTAEDTAKLLGFKMPHEPKDPPQVKVSSSTSPADRIENTQGESIRETSSSSSTSSSDFNTARV